MSEPLARLDASLDPSAATLAARAAESGVELRAEQLCETETSPPYGPLLPRPVVAKLQRGAGEVEINGECVSASALQIAVRSLDWGGWGGTAFTKHLAQLTVELGSKTYVLGEQLAGSESDARSPLDELKEALLALASGEPASDDPPRKPVPMSERLCLRFEGDYLVLRDYESQGPRRSVGRFRSLTLAAAVLAAIAWYMFSRELQQQPRVLSSLLGVLVVALVASLGAFAMFEIARFSGKYKADNAPLAWIHDDRLVMFPWVSRDGAIDLQPEGQLGAALRISDLIDIELKSDKSGTHLIVISGHGPAHLLSTPDRELATHYRAALIRSLLAVSAPTQKRLRLGAAAEA